MQQQQKTINTLQQQLLAIQTATITATTPAATVTPAPAPAPVMVPIPEIAPSPKFSGERDQVVGFINTCHLFMQMRMDVINGL